MSTIIKIKAQPEKRFKEMTARAAWWDVVQKYHGKDTEALEKAVKRKATPQDGKRGRWKLRLVCSATSSAKG